MTLETLIAALSRLAESREDDALRAIETAGFDVTRARLQVLRAGHRIVDDIRIAGVRQRLVMIFDALDQEWMVAFPDRNGDVIDPARRYGDGQITRTSPTGRGYALLCAVPHAATITASLPDNRLESVSVRRPETRSEPR